MFGCFSMFYFAHFIIRQNELQNDNDDFLDHQEEQQEQEDEEDEESDEENDPTDIHVGDVLRTTIKNALWENMQNQRNQRN